MNDPLIHIPLYLDEWHARLSGYDYLQRGAFITLFIAYVKSSGELNFEGNNSALFRACGAITDDEQKSLLEIYKEVKLFADPRIMKQVEVRETRRKNAQLGGIAKGLANAKPNAKILAEQKVSKRSAKSELELESDSERELKEEKDTIVSKKKAEPKSSFGVKGLVKMTDAEYQKLCDTYGKTETDNKIIDFEACKEFGKYKDHYLTVNKWLRKDVQPKKNLNIFSDEELNEENGI